MPQPKVGRGNGTPRTHGLTGSRTYRIWINMRQRATNANHPRFGDYGGRGVIVCPRWESFENFLADMGEAPPNMSIERQDNDGIYCVGNCRWATRSEQMSNTRRSRKLTHDGRTQTLAQWRRELGLSVSGAKYRLRAHGTLFI